MIKTIISIITIFLFTTSLFSQITEIGLASFYADKYDGRVTASGDIFDQEKMTAAHRTLPFGTKVTVTNIENKKVVVVIINDRGPFVNDRVIDLSKGAAKELGFIPDGVTRVRVEVISLGKTKSKKNSTYKKESVSTVVSTPKQKEIVKENVSVNVKKDALVTTSNNVEYYQIESSSILPVGYGVQIASYKDMANLLKRYNSIKKDVSKDIIVKISGSDGDKVYRVIIGTFGTRELASSFNKRLNNRFAGSFIVAF